jgi:hypothetical protein
MSHSLRECPYLYLSGQAILFVYDVTNYDSFQNLEDWYRIARQTFGDGGTPPFLGLIGNKSKEHHPRPHAPPILWVTVALGSRQVTFPTSVPSGTTRTTGSQTRTGCTASRSPQSQDIR